MRIQDEYELNIFIDSLNIFKAPGVVFSGAEITEAIPNPVPQCKLNLTVPLAYKFQDTISPMGYLKYRYDRSYYDEHDVFLKMLNNDYEEKDQEIIKRFTSLEKVKFIKGKRDSVIVPRESSWFEFYDYDGKTIIPLKESDFYIYDAIGLKKLMDEGKVSFVELDQEHVLYNMKEYRDEILSFFLD